MVVLDVILFILFQLLSDHFINKYTHDEDLKMTFASKLAIFGVVLSRQHTWLKYG